MRSKISTVADIYKNHVWRYRIRTNGAQNVYVITGRRSKKLFYTFYVLSCLIVSVIFPPNRYIGSSFITISWYNEVVLIKVPLAYRYSRVHCLPLWSNSPHLVLSWLTSETKFEIVQSPFHSSPSPSLVKRMGVKHNENRIKTETYLYFEETITKFCLQNTQNIHLHKQGVLIRAGGFANVFQNLGSGETFIGDPRVVHKTLGAYTSRLVVKFCF